MRRGLLKNILVLSFIGSMMVCNNSINVFADETNVVTEAYTDSETIKNVQIALNNAGYDCGAADGIMGQKTKDAILKYQADNGLEKTGNIDGNLLDKLGIAFDENEIGISLSTFVERYNEGIGYYNIIAGQENYKQASEISESDLQGIDDSFKPDGQLIINVNPNTKHKDPVGIINIWTDNLNSVDNNLATGEIMAAIYGFDISLEDGSDALDIFKRLMSGEAKISENGITYDNYSFSGMLMIKGAYDGFEIIEE